MKKLLFISLFVSALSFSSCTEEIIKEVEVVKTNYPDSLQIMIDAAHAGGGALRQYFGAELDVVEKSNASDYCTTADLEAEKAILGILKKSFPEYNFFSEEQGPDYKKSDYTFLIDPLDGTNNFVLGVPYFSTSIALTEWNTTRFGVVHHPLLNLTYHGTKGEGSYLQSKKMQVSPETDIERSTIAYAYGYSVDTERAIKLLNCLKRKEVKRTLVHWSPALDFCALAAG